MTRSEILSVAKPILFGTEMVRAILDGRKTQTRRVIKPQPDNAHSFAGFEVVTPFVHNALFECGEIRNLMCCEWTESVKFPYLAGDYLYVRETWQYIDWAGENNGYVYKASQNGKNWEENTEMWTWTPSIHMPKEAARIFLRVTNVRVERLQDISAEDILKEGIQSKGEMNMAYEFRKLWDSTVKKSELGKYGADANPWVWVYEFERIDCTGVGAQI